jgi:hypothetical protein
MRDVVILFTHLIVVSYPARLCLLASPGVISSFAEFPSEMLGKRYTHIWTFRRLLGASTISFTNHPQLVHLPHSSMQSTSHRVAGCNM